MSMSHSCTRPFPGTDSAPEMSCNCYDRHSCNSVVTISQAHQTEHRVRYCEHSDVNSDVVMITSDNSLTILSLLSSENDNQNEEAVNRAVHSSSLCDSALYSPTAILKTIMNLLRNRKVQREKKLGPLNNSSLSFLASFPVLWLFIMLLCSRVPVACANSVQFNAVGSTVPFVVPDGVSSLAIELRGASGGGNQGGWGAVVNIPNYEVTAGETLYITIGGRGDLNQGGANGGGVGICSGDLGGGGSSDGEC